MATSDLTSSTRHSSSYSKLAMACSQVAMQLVYSPEINCCRAVATSAALKLVAAQMN
jgi:hypothetical protein